jgi:hypothetical protein
MDASESPAWIGVIMPPDSMAVWRLGGPGDKPDSSAAVRKVVDLPDGLAEAVIVLRLADVGVYVAGVAAGDVLISLRGGQ